MKSLPAIGDRHRLSFRLPETKTASHLYPESADFQALDAKRGRV